MPFVYNYHINRNLSNMIYVSDWCSQNQMTPRRSELHTFFSLSLSRIGTISSLAVDVSNSRLFPFFADVLNKIGSMQPVNWLKIPPKSMEPINWLRQSGRLRFSSCAKLHSNIFSFRIKIKLSFRTKMCFFGILPFLPSISMFSSWVFYF